MDAEKTEIIEKEQEKNSDYSWPVIGANWFLLSVAISIAARWGTFPELLGTLTGYAVLAAVPTCLIFLAVKNKKAFRWKRTLTISAWVILPIWLYGAISMR